MKSINTQGPQGNNVLNWPEVGRRMMKKAGVDPDKPLDVNWKAVRDIRDNRDPYEIGRQIQSRRLADVENGNSPRLATKVADLL